MNWPPPNIAQQRTPSAAPPSPLSFGTLGRFDFTSPRALRLITLPLLAFAMAACFWGQNGRYVDERLDEHTYFVQEIRTSEKHEPKVEREALCHLARLTADAGYEYFDTISTGRAPNIAVKPGESISTATIRMFKEAPSVNDPDLISVRIVKRTCGVW